MHQVSVRLLSIDDSDAILEFERENRDWFEQWVPPRPDGYFDPEFHKKINEGLVSEAEAGTAYMHLIFDNEVIAGRINLSNIDRGGESSADVGYRISKNCVGRGIATQALEAVEYLALDAYGIKILNSSCLEINPASIAVLTRNGFSKTADRSEIKWQGEPVNMVHFRKILA